MKRLYISDLDGTLLRSDLSISDECSQTINDCIADGAFFTFATARTAASAVKITESININVPCILMNGVSVYDISQKKYVKNEYMPPEKSALVAKLLDNLGQAAFMYKISEDKLSCEYNKLDLPEQQEFYQRRRDRYDKPFTRIESFSDSCNKDVVYFTMLDCFERLEPISEEIDALGGLKYELYKDIYSENVWYLEVFSENASKYNGVRFLRENYGFDEIVCFGDNLNDIPMFRASDIRVAVENAKDEVKLQADFIAASNNEDGAAKWLCRHYNENIERKLI